MKMGLKSRWTHMCACKESSTRVHVKKTQWWTLVWNLWWVWVNRSEDESASIKLPCSGYGSQPGTISTKVNPNASVIRPRVVLFRQSEKPVFVVWDLGSRLAVGRESVRFILMASMLGRVWSFKSGTQICSAHNELISSISAGRGYSLLGKSSRHEGALDVSGGGWVGEE